MLKGYSDLQYLSNRHCEGWSCGMSNFISRIAVQRRTVERDQKHAFIFFLPYSVFLTETLSAIEINFTYLCEYPITRKPLHVSKTVNNLSFKKYSQNFNLSTEIRISRILFFINVSDDYSLPQMRCLVFLFTSYLGFWCYFLV